jgi:hypothetical protein
MWEPRHLTTLWDFTARYRDSFFSLRYSLFYSFGSHEEDIWNSEVIKPEKYIMENIVIIA